MIPDTIPVIPFNALPIDAHGGTLDPDNPLRHADVIFVRDVNDPKPVLFYGKDVLRRIVESGESESVSVLCVELDADTDELEALAAMVMVIHGSCDYPGGDGPDAEPKHVWFGGAKI
jgi:hypothetical protein